MKNAFRLLMTTALVAVKHLRAVKACNVTELSPASFALHCFVCLCIIVSDVLAVVLALFYSVSLHHFILCIFEY